MDFTLVAQIFDILRIAPPSKLILLEAETLSFAHVPPYPPDMPVLFTNISSAKLALQLKKVLLTTYPAVHVVFFVTGVMIKMQSVGELCSLGVIFLLYVP